MKIVMKKYLILFAASSLIATACKKDYGNLNNPTEEVFLANATRDQLNNLVSGTESTLRNNLGLYLDDIGVVGREMYRFSGADPRYVTDLLGGGESTLSNTGFYITNVWSSRYRVVKNCNLLEEAAGNSTYINDAEKKGYEGFAKTIKAYQLLLTLNLTYTNGVRIDVVNAEQLGPIVEYDQALAEIASLLDEGKTDLSGAEVVFPLSAGFAAFSDAPGLAKFNRALAARVAVYRKQWDAALTDLDESFLVLNGAFDLGVYDVFPIVQQVHRICATFCARVLPVLGISSIRISYGKKWKGFCNHPHGIQTTSTDVYQIFFLVIISKTTSGLQPIFYLSVKNKST